MSKKQKFIEELENNYFGKLNLDDIDPDVASYWLALKGTADEDKPLFTENGKNILTYLRNNLDTPMWKARDIAEGLFISSRAVSGAIRKLVTDGFVEKVGQDPVVYAITEKGKTIEIN